MPLDTGEALLSTVDIIAFAMKVGKTMKEAPAEMNPISEGALVIRTHIDEAEQLALAIQARVKS